ATKAQFQKEVDVISYMDSRTFYSSSSGMEITYGYISMMNTYGIKLKNKNDVEFSFINCEITCYGKFADVYGMSPETGGNFGFRLFEDKLVIGYGEPNASTYYEK
ncbi:MAG: hypothetical protein EBZ77_00830, partial [Chitinophagia bacterium]|nr:hypothetical protein [Chitinophagia bacterium]